MFSDEIIHTIKKDGIGIVPTDTLYGIVGSAFSKQAVKRIYTVKGRDENKPFIILVSSVSDLKKFGIVVSLFQKKFLENIWPNSVSVIIPCPLKKFEYLHRGSRSLAFRLPKNKKLQQFLKKTGPLVAPSANPQGEKPAETVREAKKYFGTHIDFYVSDGRKNGKPSTIVSLENEKPTLLREGSVRLKL